MMDVALQSMPLVAILRGVLPDEVADIGQAIYQHGVRCIEVPLNSPTPFDSVRALAAAMPDDCIVGAGTVLNVADVQAVHDVGGRLIVSPNTDEDVIRAAVALGMHVAPGVATPTDALNAVRWGAHYLKLFPATTYGPTHLKAMLDILPEHARVLAVGGIAPDDFAAWHAAGAVGFGLGSTMYKPGDSPSAVSAQLEIVCAALSALAM